MAGVGPKRVRARLPKPHLFEGSGVAHRAGSLILGDGVAHRAEAISLQRDELNGKHPARPVFTAALHLHSISLRRSASAQHSLVAAGSHVSCVHHARAPTCANRWLEDVGGTGDHPGAKEYGKRHRAVLQKSYQPVRRRLANNLQFAKASAPRWLTFLEMFTLDNELQFAKASSPISVTEPGMVTLFKELQFAKAPSPMQITELGMVKLSNELQSAKAHIPMRVTELGTVTLAKELQPRKVSSPRSVTELEMVTLDKELQFAKA